MLIQQPIAALQSLKTNPLSLDNITVSNKRELSVKGQQLEMQVVFEPGKNSTAGVRLAEGKKGAFVVGFDEKNEKLFIDRTGVGDTSFNNKYPILSRYEAPLSTINHKIKLQIFFDNSIIEVFANYGTTVMTAQIFPDQKENSIELFSDVTPTKFESVKVWKMRSAWK
jgi:sucrose-6-phosphate hydrolase SacC (GH32 family)